MAKNYGNYIFQMTSLGDYLLYVLKVLCEAKLLSIFEYPNKIVRIEQNCIGKEFAKICFQGGVSCYN